MGGGLLDMALKAHDSLDRWNKGNYVRVDASIPGDLRLVKGKSDVIKDVVITAETKREQLTMVLRGHNERTSRQFRLKVEVGSQWEQQSSLV